MRMLTANQIRSCLQYFKLFFLHCVLASIYREVRVQEHAMDAQVRMTTAHLYGLAYSQVGGGHLLRGSHFLFNS